MRGARRSNPRLFNVNYISYPATRRNGWFYSVRSSRRASGAFCITEVIPFFTLVADAQVSLLPIGSPLAAFRMKYCWPFFAFLFSKRSSLAFQ
jgi:hypothetical protein